MRISFLFFATVIILTSCSNNSNTTATTPDTAITVADTPAPKNYFPVNDFIKEEINYADTYFGTYTKYVTTGNKKDSLVIKPEEFKQLAREFTTDDLSKTALEKDYAEASFIDQTTGMATFTYSTGNDSLSVKRIDVLAKQGEGFDKINSIYIEKMYSIGDTAIRKKINWKSHKNVQVITETTIGKQAPKINHYKIVWDAVE